MERSMLVKKLCTILTTAIGSCALLAFPLMANAQPVPVPVPVAVFNDPYCGSMQNGIWIANGNCGAAGDVSAARVSGTITFVRGHLVTLQQSSRQIVINDQPALDMRTTGRVAVGRVIEAIGYWHDGTFYATTLLDEPASR